MNNNTVRTKSVAKKIECFILLSFFCLLTPSLYAESSSAYAQAKKFTVTLNNVTLKEVISYVEKNSEFVFFYQPSEIKSVTNVNVHVKDETINSLLDQILIQTHIKYEIKDRQVVLKKETPAVKETTQKKHLLQGLVKDEQGNPIHISTDLTDWTVQPGSSWSKKSYTVTDSATGDKTYASQNLEPKKSVVLTKTITSRPTDGTVQVEIKGYDIYAGTLPTYTYVAEKSNKPSGDPFTETDEQGTVKSAQNLAAGGLTGRNEWKIQEIRQNLTILQADRKEMDNRPELKAGGIAGEVVAGSQIEDVYLTGAVKSSVDGAKTGLAAGSGTGSLTKVIAPAASSEGDLGSGLTVTDAKIGAEAKPDTWSNWTAFSYYESADITAQSRADESGNSGRKGCFYVPEGGGRSQSPD